MKILIVEDNVASLKLVTQVLETAGMEVLQATLAEEAFDLIKKTPVDLVLTDIMLPGMDGLSLSRKLKLDAATANIPIVAMTANASCDLPLACDAGCDSLIRKPIDTRGLAAQLMEILHCSGDKQQSSTDRTPEITGAGTAPGAPAQILVVEDDPASLRLAGAVLMASGYLVSVATTAAQAILSVEANPPDLIVLDLNLPGIDGLETARELKQNPATRHIPILAVTAYSDLFSKQAALSAQCNAYLNKPLDTRRLPQQLAGMLMSKANHGGTTDPVSLN
jgi:two-component system cell cycle response regulator